MRVQGAMDPDACTCTIAYHVQGAMDPDAEACKPKHNIPDDDLAALNDPEMPKRIIITGSDDRSVTCRQTVKEML